MRILHVAIRLAESDGGPPQGLVSLAKAQSLQGDDVTILPCSSSGGRMAIEPGVYGKLTVLEPPTNGKVIWPNGKLKRLLVSLAKDMDIVHIQGSWRYHLIAASAAARSAGIPYVVRPAGHLGRVPRKSKAYVKAPYFAFIERPIFQKASALHCCTTKELRELEDIKLSSRCFVAPLPVDDSLVDVDADTNFIKKICPGLADSDIMLLYLGRIGWIKRLPILAEAFTKISDKFKNSHLVLAGPWEEPKIIDDIKAIIRESNLRSRVHLPGMVKGGAKVALLKRATVFVQPSSHENFGLSVAEALLFGKACVVSDGVALSDDIAQAKAGLVFCGKAEPLAEALDKMLSDDTFRHSCEDAAKRVCEKFKPDAVVRKLKEEYNRCIKELK